MKIIPNVLSPYKKFEAAFLRLAYKKDPNATFTILEISNLFKARYTPLGAYRCWCNGYKHKGGFYFKNLTKNRWR